MDFGFSLGEGAGLFAVLLAFARIAGILHTMPLISAKAVPIPIRVGLALLLAVVVAPLAPPVETTWDPIPMSLMAGSELLLGAAMGFCATLLLSVLDVAGHFIGMNSGLGIAMQFDPLTQGQALVVTKLIQTGGMMIFLALDLHHQILFGLADSFLIAPAGSGVLLTSAGGAMSAVVGGLFADAMRISMPVVAAVLFLNLVSALVTRFAQQMNIYFSVGLPANAMAGLFAASLCIPAIAAAVIAAGGGMRDMLASVVGVG